MALRFRTIDGSNNNLSDAALNQANTDFARVGPANFADGFGAMQPGPNPREISNIVVANGPDTHLEVNGVALSGMMYAWGQFVDHDLDLEKSGTNTADISIPVPAGDSLPQGTVIPLTRVAIDPATGVLGHPATAINTVTGWLDGSQVYGSDTATAASLRTADGHMKVSAGDNLPIVMTAQGPAFAAGDVRAQENPDLTALQTLFVREHNYQVDKLHQEHPHWSGDRLYETAKAITTAEMVNITYNEFLPHLLGSAAIPAYHGYDPNVNASITEEFEGAAYRFGHSIVSSDINGINNLGATTSEQSLADTFFESPAAFAANGGADGLLRHLSSDIAQPLDTHIIEDLRSLLSDPPDAVDLAATNIQRAHDLGLGTLNETRAALGLARYTSFNQITSDSDTASALRQAYGTVDAIDLWTGGLAEAHTSGAAIGPTFGKIIADQFTALRDGDRLYFENQGFDPQTLQEIKSTTLSDIIKRDTTGTTAMQADAFISTERHSGALGGVDPTGADAVSGQAQLIVGSPGEDTLTGGNLDDTLVAAPGHMTMTGGAGADTFVFNLEDLVNPEDCLLAPRGHRTMFNHDITAAHSAVITDFDPKVDQLQLLNRAFLSLSYDHHGGTLLQYGNETIDLLGVRPDALRGKDWT
ncbi:peroxidase family protein [Bradyrhizobium sp. SEMIA]|uniref:peroxidase family protein n=1 Tax=Bradyrhizobium sp. SEMIA TaxID=2597515 RepID=UPI0018A50F0D|nr:peroxidase family protein [Bradyrhizobium sp. SEMIA]QOG19687.1 peroxidase [Bradyrhizobium sp. SEMIA]